MASVVQKCVRCAHDRQLHDKDKCRETIDWNTGKECKCPVKNTDRHMFRVEMKWFKNEKGLTSFALLLLAYGIAGILAIVISGIALLIFY